RVVGGDRRRRRGPRHRPRRPRAGVPAVRPRRTRRRRHRTRARHRPLGRGPARRRHPPGRTGHHPRHAPPELIPAPRFRPALEELMNEASVIVVPEHDPAPWPDASRPAPPKTLMAILLSGAAGGIALPTRASGVGFLVVAVVCAACTWWVMG